MDSRALPSSPPTSPLRRSSRSCSAMKRNFELIVDLPPSPSRKRSPSTFPVSKPHHNSKKRRLVRDVDASISAEKENMNPGASLDDITRDQGMDVEDESISCAKGSLLTPRTTPTKKSLLVVSPSLPPRVLSNIFAHAHSLLSTSSTLHSDLPLLGRDSERRILLDFLSSRFDDLYPERVTDNDKTRPSIYISGPPGLGKTALLSDILSDFIKRIKQESTLVDPLKTPRKKKAVGKAKRQEGVRVHMENCSSIGTVGMETGLWERLGRGLGIWDNVKRGGKVGFEDALEQNEGVRYLIILDEIDHILAAKSTTKNSLLNQLFTLVHSGKYPITLVGIANALDLTVRSLHLSNLNPVDAKGKGKGKAIEGAILLHFEPYKPADIVAIVKQRLLLLSTVDEYPHSLSPDSATAPADPTSKSIPLIQPAALEFCAKKVAAATGDVRTALAIIQYSINMVESAELAKLSKSDSSSSTPSPPAKNPPVKATTKIQLAHLAKLNATTAPKVTFSHILASLKVSNLSTKVVTLESKLGELAFNARMVLVGIVISLFRSRHASTSTKGKSKSGMGPSGKEEVRLADAFEIYKEILKKEGTLKPMTREEFRTTLDNSLEGNAFISISFSSSRSTTNTPPTGKGRKKILGGDSSNPLISLAEGLLLADVAKALRLVPSTSDSSSTTNDEQVENKVSGVLEETLRISICLLDREERRLEGVKRMRMIDGEVPMEGFHGDGLGSGRWIGEKRRRVEDD